MFKFILFIFSFFTIAISAFCQNLTNYDFEKWYQSDSFEEPVGWSTSNFSVFSVITFNTVTKELTDVYSGQSSIKLTTIEKNINGDNVKIAGLITLGTFDVNISTRKAVVKGGVQIREKPSIFSGFYKYSTTGIDSCIMSIFLTRYNTETNKRDTVGSGIFTSSNQADWTQFEAPISYNSNIDPDSMNIVVLSSDTSIFEPGSTLYLDDLYIDGVVSINPILVGNYLEIYPNPTSSNLTVEINNYKNAQVNIYSSIGVLRSSFNLNSSNDKINISNLEPGFYFISLIKEDYKPITKSFIIK